MNTLIHKLNYTLNNNQFYIKRDDLIPQYYGGNKVRIAQEYYRDMVKKRSNCFVAYGSENSNMCRVIALMSAEKGYPCFIVYGCEKNEKKVLGINDILVKNSGADIIKVSKSNIKEAIEMSCRKAKQRGYKPYYIFGNSQGKGNEKTGVKGYISCYKEIKAYEEIEKIIFDYIFVTSGTGITQAGLIAGSVLENGEEQIIGISISREKKKQEEYIRYYLNQYFEKMIIWNENIIQVYDKALQGGYGYISERNKNFISNFCKKNSVPLDYTYIGKGIYGMMKYLEEKKILGKKILFIHTGATPLFYEDILK
ncbi:pyridoxal-phosphate dependent enzyme [Sporofaciens sp. JLR.KK001]|uniref:1-aminocyclopropane-1-carboxylate deaminase/D-cysteine desulfhydrase n=1 Tax=Sporofaciens sp. JLR.KK001 TaxID=3112621 RepID=UPI002FF2BB80